MEFEPLYTLVGSRPPGKLEKMRSPLETAMPVVIPNKLVFLGLEEEWNYQLAIDYSKHGPSSALAHKHLDL
jgi:hypothetical protein